LEEGFVSGHRFSDANNGAKGQAALQAAEKLANAVLAAKQAAGKPFRGDENSHRG
jgi:hypothetical protein